MSDGFSITSFLEEWGSDFEPKFDVMQMKIAGGFGVFAGRQSKFFEIKSNDLAKKVREEADAYVATLTELEYTPKVLAAVEQVWYAPILNREKQPSWEGGEWHEMKRRTVVQVNGEWPETGDWVVFKRQWADDNAPIKESQFGEKLWVLASYVAHPDFNPNMPDKYTAQMRDGQFVVDQNGAYKPQYIRVVNTVLGSRAQADAWLAANGGGGTSGGGEQKESLTQALLDLRSSLPPKVRKEYGSDQQWLDSVSDVFNGIHNGKDQSGWIETGLMTEEVIEKVKELVKVYPPL